MRFYTSKKKANPVSAPPAESARHAKRSKFTQESRSQGNPLYVLVPAALIVALALGYFFLQGQGRGQPTIPTANQGTGSSALRRSSARFTTVVAQDGAVKLSVADFADGKARFYTYREPSSGKEIDFFVLKSSDGVIRAAIDACDVCYPFKKGYRQEGDEMVCNNCGRRFPSIRVNDVTGGCNPAALTRSVQGDMVVVLVSDILKDNVSQTGQPLF